MLNKNLVIGTIIFAVVVVLAIFFISKPVQIPIEGVLRQANGTTVDDGFYDLRVVGIDGQTGLKTLEQDFIDVYVSDGQYKLPVKLQRFSSTGDNYLQICRTELASAEKDGLQSGAPAGCKAPVEEQTTFTFAECPQTISIDAVGGIGNLLGKRQASLFDQCVYLAEEENGLSELLAPSNASQPSVTSLMGEKGSSQYTGGLVLDGFLGQKGDVGEKGDTGPQGPAGPQGVPGQTGSNGPAGDPALDDQILSFGGAQILSIAGGNSVDLSALLDNTDVLASLSCSNGQVAQWNGSAWICANAGVDTDDQTLLLMANSLSIDSGNSVSLASYLDNTDAQSIAINSNIISISGNASTINLAPYLDDTDTQDLSLATNTLTLVAGGSVSLAGYLDNTDNQSLFSTFVIDNGTNPAADSATDTLSFVSGTGVTIIGDGTTDTITISSVLGTSIDSSEIVNETILSEDILNGTIQNSDLTNSSLTVLAGSGLITGGAVSLGGTVTLDIGSGTAITVNGNDVAVTADGINYTEIADSLTLDASTTTTLGSFTQTTNLDSTGDVVFQDNGFSFMTITDAGAYDFTLDATDNPAYTITNAGSSNVNTNLSGSGDFTIQDNETTVLTVLDNGTFQFRNSVDNASSFLVEEDGGLDIFEIDTVANAVRIGELVDDTADVLLVLDGAGSADPAGIAGGMYYNTTDSKFRCYENGAWKDCIAELDTATFADINPAAFADNDTTQLFNDATKPNISVRSATSTVMVTFNIDGLSNTVNDAYLAARIVFAAGADPSCTTSTQVGRPNIATFTTTTTTPYSINGSFIHTPGTAGNIRYTVCTSANALGTVTATAANVTVSLVELGP